MNIPEIVIEEDVNDEYEIEEIQEYNNCIIIYDTSGEQYIELTEDS